MEQIIKALCVTLLLLNGSDILRAQENQTEDYKSYQQAYNLVLDEQWPEAQKAIKKFIQAFPNSDWKDDAEFWFCYTIEKRSRLPEAAACYEKFIKENKDSKWYNNAQTNLLKIASQLPPKARDRYGNLLQSLQQDNNEEIALTALYALKNSKDERVRTQSLNLLKRAQNSSVRAGAIQVLYRFDYTPEVIETLKKVAWEDPDFHVRNNAMLVLIQKKYTNPADSISAIKTISEIAQKDPNPNMRTQALTHLVQHNPTQATAFLTDKIFNDKEIQRSALSAVPSLPKNDASELLIKVTQTHPDLKMRKEACHLLARKFPQKALLLAEQIAQEHDDVDMHLLVVNILHSLPNKKGIPQLIEIAKSHPILVVRQRAIESLRYYNKDERVIQALLDLTEIK